VHKLKRKRYNSLVDVKREIQEKGKEVIKVFDGCVLTTNKNRYTMIDSIVYVNGVAHGVD
jgi:hypothetical protein